MLESLAVAALAAARITRLTTTDTITEPIRVKIRAASLNHFENRPLRAAAYIVGCDYCASIYAGGVASALVLAGERWRPARWLALGLAASGAVTIYAEQKKAPPSPW